MAIRIKSPERSVMELKSGWAGIPPLDPTLQVHATGMILMGSTFFREQNLHLINDILKKPGEVFAFLAPGEEIDLSDGTNIKQYGDSVNLRLWT